MPKKDKKRDKGLWGFDIISAVFLVVGIIFLVLSLQALLQLPAAMAEVSQISSTLMTTYPSVNVGSIAQTAVLVATGLGFVVGFAEIAAGLMYARFAPDRRRLWAMVGLVFGIVGLFSTGDVIFITPTLCIIAGIFGIIRNR
jgi:hypothetical protein